MDCPSGIPENSRLAIQESMKTVDSHQQLEGLEKIRELTKLAEEGNSHFEAIASNLMGIPELQTKAYGAGSRMCRQKSERFDRH